MHMSVIFRWPLLSVFSGNVQAQLDEQVPYQGDTLLTNPNQFRVTSAGDVLMDCDWPAMMAMIRDLEERIAGKPNRYNLRCLRSGSMEIGTQYVARLPGFARLH